MSYLQLREGILKMESVVNTLTITITTIIVAPVIALLIVAYLTIEKFRTEVNRLFIWSWLNLKIFMARYWIWLIAVALILVSIRLYFYFGSFWIFLIAYSIWVTIVASFKKRPSKQSPAISCILGSPKSETGEGGLKFVSYYDDGSAVKELYENVLVRRSDNKADQHYLYFAIKDDLAKDFRNKPVIVIVEYFDLDQDAEGNDKGKRGLTLKYDGKGNGIQNIFKKGGKILFTSSNTWKLGVFTINDGFFRKRQQGVADFRLACLYPNQERDYDIIIRKIMMVPLIE